MARIRTIKPDFFTSEQIVALSPMARLLFIATWCEADKEGRLAWRPKTFKMRYLPGDDCDVDAVCDELVQSGLVVLYGDGLAYIPGFHKHQHVNPRESASTHPAPPEWQELGPKKIGKTVREAVLERDGNRCVRCGSIDKLQIDHILPQSCGGPHIPENLRVLCQVCNAGRPVNGKALEDDLAKDGFTLETLRVKFGIDVSIPDLHAQVGRKEGKEGKEKSGSGANAPDPKKVFWDSAIECVGESNRARVGKFCKQYGEDAVAAAVAKAAMKRPANPIGYIAEILQSTEHDPFAGAF